MQQMQTADLRNDQQQVDFVKELFINNNNLDLNSPMLKKQHTSSSSKRSKDQNNSG